MSLVRNCPHCGLPVHDASIWQDFGIGRFHIDCMSAAESSGRWQPWQLGKGMGKASAPKATSWERDWQRKEGQAA